MLVGDPWELVLQVLLQTFRRELFLGHDPDVVLQLFERQFCIGNFLLLGLEILFEVRQLVIESDQDGSFLFQLGFGALMVALHILVST